MYESWQVTIFLICIKQLYSCLPPAFSEFDDSLGKLLELLSAANSTVHPVHVHSIFISSTTNNRIVAQDTLLFEILETLPPLFSQIVISFLFLRPCTHQMYTTLNWGGGGGGGGN